MKILMTFFVLMLTISTAKAADTFECVEYFSRGLLVAPKEELVLKTIMPDYEVRGYSGVRPRLYQFQNPNTSGGKIGGCPLFVTSGTEGLVQVVFHLNRSTNWEKSNSYLKTKGYTGKDVKNVCAYSSSNQPDDADTGYLICTVR
ncbi:MAG: hypothetical protein AB7F59_14010 [Bdellovibrionales bacterium]